MKLFLNFCMTKVNKPIAKKKHMKSIKNITKSLRIKILSINLLPVFDHRLHLQV